MNYRPLLCASLLTLAMPACTSDSDDGGTSSEAGSSTSDSGDETSGSEAASDTSSDAGDGDGDSGDGDSGDGDGDSGDGDGDAAVGEQLWTEGGHMQRCGGCHGENGQYPPEALAGGLSEAEILDQIVNGGAVMPAQVPDELTAGEAAHIAAYLASLG